MKLFYQHGNIRFALNFANFLIKMFIATFFLLELVSLCFTILLVILT